ncbi:hypothetical protein J1C67_10700 [Clostridium gasigenes]|uniref:hypothetical protein n=1 Tax=Clostridium gasigenes TaxID=94869 RepID=UPI0014385203|nr:hypothetical protein [Clostridium gasigenes]NKF07613.1 hypothetical protein [Clostridium gasigenes]QSW18041.1 hypothetical protein J1C67_10700 [Clostridium gasigenes]
MKCYSVAKYNLASVKKSMIIYYSIFISVLIVMSYLQKHYRDGNIVSSGIEISTVIFLFVIGLNYFKENFYFSQSNNISRKTYFKGTILSILIIAAIASLLDVIINRVYNLFTKSPTGYDMIFTSFRDLETAGTTSIWIQNNDVVTLLNTFLLQFSVYIMIFTLGLTIVLIYYKCNKLMKTIISIGPIIIAGTFEKLFSEIGIFIQNILGWNTMNPYGAIGTFIVIFIILIGFIYLLVKKAIIKER